jgi:putative membrane protein
MRLLLIWLINAVALLALKYIMPSITVDSFVTALIVAVVLGLINTLIRPLFVLLTLPVTILTLGLFLFVINGLLFWAVGSFVPGFPWRILVGRVRRDHLQHHLVGVVRFVALAKEELNGTWNGLITPNVQRRVLPPRSEDGAAKRARRERNSRS